jgi:hypothetical protein
MMVHCFTKLVLLYLGPFLKRSVSILIGMLVYD